MQGSGSLAERHRLVLAAIEAVTDLQQVLFQAPSGELEDLVANLGELSARCVSQVAAVAAEAEQRGVVVASQAASTSGWIAELSPELADRASQLSKCARVLRRPDLREVADDVLALQLTPAAAVRIGVEFDQLVPQLRPEAIPVVLQAFRQVGAEHGVRGVRQLHAELIARYGEQGEFDDEQEKCRRRIELSPARECSGMWHYELTVDAEGHAVLESAIGPLSAPVVGPDGERDLRPVGRRRGEALVAALGRSVAASTSYATHTKTALMVTMDLDDLVDGLGGGQVLGTLAEGEWLAPDVVRRLACEASIIPAVLGSKGELLDLGLESRLFTAAQKRALWLRDGHCSFPACTAPATWSDAHHLQHWVDGGRSDLSNGALLCPRHHSVVHRDELHGRVVDGRVEWDRRPGSYPFRRERRVA